MGDTTTLARTSPVEPAGAPPQRKAGSSSLGRHFAALDGYRGSALVFILFYHSKFSWARGAFFSLTQFFTLSGFLIASMLLRAHASGGIGLRVFWARRFRRLMPASLLGLIIVMVFGATVATRQQAADLPAGVFAAATYWANWFFIIIKQSYVAMFADPSPVQHYWSLSLEEQFYLLMPVGMVLLLRKRRPPSVQAAVFAGGALLSTGWMIFLYYTGASLDRLYYGTDTRVAEMLCGGFLAVVLFHHGFDFGPKALRIVRYGGLVVFAAMLWAMSTISLVDPVVYRGGFLVFAILSCAAITGIVAGGPLAPVMAFAPLAFFGRISYGVYLYHWPIFLWLTESRTGLGGWPLLGLRMAVTLPIAIVSYYLVEMPIRRGARFHVSRSWVRWAIAPVAALTIVGATVVTVDRNAPDPLETFRANDASLLPPLAAADGVLDVLVIAGRREDPVVERMTQLAGSEANVEVTRAEPFSCAGITDAPAGPVCSNWLAEWPALIEEHDPEVVVLYVDDWPADELRRLSGLPDAQLAEYAGTVLDHGFDLLGARDATILWATSGSDFATALQRSLTPFFVAMENVAPRRTDVRQVVGTRMPDPATVSATEFRDESAAILLSDAALYQRADESSLPRVMVVGDSQARSMGYGLERWGASEETAVVWDISTEGCGLVADGEVHDAAGRAVDVSDACRNAVGSLADRVTSFRPDVVIVLSSIWDLNDRKIDGWSDFQGAASSLHDQYLRDEYAEAIGTFTSQGGHVVWMTAPCTETTAQAGPTGSDLSAAARLEHLNDAIIRPVVQAHPEQATLFDLDRVLCPDGEYVDRIGGIDQLRVDGTHFSVEGAIWFADTYGEELLRLGGK